MKKYHTVLSIAGSDCSGGAGIQADIKTITALGCYAASVITSLTAQNTIGVHAIYDLPPKFIEQQLDAVLNDIKPDVIKIGMLHHESCINLIYNKLSVINKNITVILDPVMVAQDGTNLISKNMTSKLQELFQHTDLITPNISEANLLTNTSTSTVDDMKKAAKLLGNKHGCAVLVKGGHLLSDNATDVLYSPDHNLIKVYQAKFIKTNNTHGTGCTLSSAIACFLAKEADLYSAVEEAKQFVKLAIESGSKYKIGQGSGPVNHLVNIGGIK